MKIYISGPMRGYHRCNFKAFYDAEAELKAKGHEVVNPARIDEENGFDPESTEITSEMLAEFVRRDVEAIISVDALAMLPGWMQSIGATAEYHIALWLGKRIFIFCFDNTSNKKLTSC